MYKIVSFNDFLINDGVNYAAEFNGPSFLGSTDASHAYVKQTNSDSVAAGVFTVGQKSISITVSVKATSGRGLLVNQLRYRLQRGIYGKLVVTFLDDNVDYYVNAAITSLQPTSVYDGYYIITMTTGDTAWRALTVSTDTWAISAGTEATKTISVEGADATRLILSLTPTSSPAIGYLYQNYYNVINIPGKSYARLPFCINIDSYALIHATPSSKMQASCNDLRILIDGQEVERWIAGADTHSTNVWFNISLAPGGTLTLQTEVPAAGTVTTLVFQNTMSNYLAYNAIPSSGYVYHGGEWFHYNGKSRISNTYYGLNNIVRGLLGTTQVKHTTGSAFNFIQHTVAMVYGNSTIEDPAENSSYDNLKPVFNLTSSTNNAWVYDATTPYYSPGRPGSWVPTISTAPRNTVSEFYTFKQNAESGDYVLGMKIACYILSGRWQDGQTTLTWELTHPAGIYQVAATGEKYRNTTRWVVTSLLNNAGLQKYITTTGGWSQVWNEASPGAANTWGTPFTHAATTLNTTKARFVFWGSFTATANAYAELEILTCTISFISTYVPTATALGEKGNYTLDATIENTTNGDSVRLKFPMMLNVSMDLDCENYTVYYNNTSVYSALIIDDAWRDVWIRLVPGSNVLKITSNGFGNMTGAISWYTRRV